ncbi:MAG: tetratricopeptide repeat protein, partial [Bacteroidota bacterium]
ADSTKGRILFEDGMAAYMNADDWEILVNKFTEAIDFLETAGPWDMYVVTCQGLNKYYSEESYNFDSIEKYNEKLHYALTTHIEERDLDYHEALYDIGSYRIRQGSYNQALRIFQEVYTYYQTDTTIDKDDYSAMYHSLGLCYKQKGDFNEAMRFYDRSIEILDNEPSLSLVDRYNMKAKLLYELKRPEESKVYYQKAMETIEKRSKNEKDYEYLVDFHISLAKMAAEEGDEANTYQHLNKSEEFQKYLKNQILGGRERILRQLYAKKKEYAQALIHQEEAEKIHIDKLASRKGHPTLMKLRLHRAEIYEEQQRYQEAIELLQENISSLTDGWQHSDLYENPLPDRITQPIFCLPQYRLKAKNLYHLYKEKDKPEILWASLETYKLSVELIETLRKGFKSNESTLLLAEISSPTLEEALEVAWEAYRINPDEKSLQYALDLMEVNKAALLQAALQEAVAKNNHLISAEILDEESKLEDNISDLQRMIYFSARKENPDGKEFEKVKKWKAELFQLENKKQELINRIESEYPEYYESKYQISKVTIEQIRKKLSHEELFIEYYWGEQYTFLLAIDNNDLHFERIPLNSKIVVEFEDFLNILKRRDEVYE